MLRVTLVITMVLPLVACVDGKTPDCSTVETGCFPVNYPTSDASDSSTDASVVNDAGDAGDAGDASNVTDAPTD
jgi:hypothetical protein